MAHGQVAFLSQGKHCEVTLALLDWFGTTDRAFPLPIPVPTKPFRVIATHDEMEVVFGPNSNHVLVVSEFWTPFQASDRRKGFLHSVPLYTERALSYMRMPWNRKADFSRLLIPVLIPLRIPRLF